MPSRVTQRAGVGGRKSGDWTGDPFGLGGATDPTSEPSPNTIPAGQPPAGADPDEWGKAVESYQGGGLSEFIAQRKDASGQTEQQVTPGTAGTEQPATPLLNAAKVAEEALVPDSQAQKDLDESNKHTNTGVVQDDDGNFSFKKVLSKIFTKGNIAKAAVVAAPAAIGAALGGKSGFGQGLDIGGRLLAGYETERKRLIAEKEQVAIQWQETKIRRAKQVHDISNDAFAAAKSGDSTTALTLLEPLGDLLDPNLREATLEEYRKKVGVIAFEARSNIAIGSVSDGLKTLIENPSTATPEQFDDLTKQLNIIMSRSNSKEDDFGITDTQQEVVKTLLDRVAGAKKGQEEEESSRVFDLYTGLLQSATTSAEWNGIMTALNKNKAVSGKMSEASRAHFLAIGNSMKESIALKESQVKTQIAYQQSMLGINDFKLAEAEILSGNYVGAMETFGLSLSEVYHRETATLRSKAREKIEEVKLNLMFGHSEGLGGDNASTLRNQLFVQNKDTGKWDLKDEHKVMLNRMESIMIQGYLRDASENFLNAQAFLDLDEFAISSFNDVFSEDIKQRSKITDEGADNEQFKADLRSNLEDRISKAAWTELLQTEQKKSYITKLIMHANSRYDLELSVPDLLSKHLPEKKKVDPTPPPEAKEGSPWHGRLQESVPFAREAAYALTAGGVDLPPPPKKVEPKPSGLLQYLPNKGTETVNGQDRTPMREPFDPDKTAETFRNLMGTRPPAPPPAPGTTGIQAFTGSNAGQ